jgi:putative ABC transport system substrate-binding protein
MLRVWRSIISFGLYSGEGARVRRRDFVTLVGGALAWPLPVAAQDPGKIWHMGFTARGQEKFYAALFEGLRELGNEAGRNLVVERRYAGDSTEQFHEFAAVQLKIDVIVVVTTPAALAVKSATSTIPMVFPDAINPVESGVVASLARPDANVTGVSAQTAILSAKRLEILKEAVPGLSRVAVLWNGSNSALALAWKETQVATDALGVRLQSWELGPKDLEAVFAAIGQERSAVFIVLQDALTLQHMKGIAGFAVQKTLPGMFVAKEWVEAGGLMSYGESLPEMYRRAAYFVDKMFKGAKPADLPLGTSHQVRTRHQPQDCQATQPHNAGDAARPRRGVHRMNGRENSSRLFVA